MSMSTSRKKSDESICIDLNNVEAFKHFIFFYKANAVSLIATGIGLEQIINFKDEFIKKYTGFLQGIVREKIKNLKDFEILPSDFDSCQDNLTPEDLIEMKEYLKNSKILYKKRTSETYRTLSAFNKLSSLADKMLKVCFGDECLLAIIDLSKNISAIPKITEINLEFNNLMKKLRLNYIEGYVLALSLVVHKIPKCENPRADLVLIKSNYYTRIPLPAENLCRIRHFAKFYLDLAKAKSTHLSEVASALLSYVQTRDEHLLYDILRSFSQTRKLTEMEKKALGDLLAVMTYSKSSQSSD
jgi:hypothetical protein